MDLRKIQLYEEHYEMNISDKEIVKLEDSKLIHGGYFHDSKCEFDFLNLEIGAKVKLYIGSTTQDDERVFYKYSMCLSNGKIFKDCSWGYSMIPLMTLAEIRCWKKPRKFSLKIKIGIYMGTGGERWEWQNILTDAEDFSPLCSVPTSQSKCMSDLLASAMFSDIKLLCTDSILLSAHKCILIGSPYFRALFGFHFQKSNQNIVKVESDSGSMQVILSYLYSGRIEYDKVDSWPDLYQVASFYQLEDLSQHCELQMMARVTSSIDDIKYVLKFSIDFHARKLKRYLVMLSRRIQKTS